MKVSISIMSLCVFALAACSGGGASTDTSAADGMASATAAASTPTPNESVMGDSAPTPQGDCDLLSADEIAAAFAGKLTVTRNSGHGERGGSCTYYIAEVPEGQLILQAGDEAAYLAKKESYSSYRGVKMEPMAFAKEAFLVNGAQAIALRDDGKSISLALSLVAFDTPVPVTPEEAGAGVSSLAEKVTARL
ncbi:hypothetical protein [Novilysobacter antarcticus]|uniref:hypothetical protein n=1 Tax=Novilysobacter antarcticus TaxID=2862543 RepID=UPI001C9993AD|nr:hypothetical protein [Lysobacter antarcticus]